jgi:RNA polymerase sigma-70 factor (ECF subfamily)
MSTSVAFSTVVSFGDDEMIARARAGDRDLFEHVVQRYHRPVASFIHRMIGDYDTALDLTQEVFLKVYTSLDRYDEQYRFSTWLFKIASNHTIDHLRKQHGKLLSLDGPDGEMEIGGRGFASEAASPERQSILNQRRTIIESAMACLPLSYRQVMMLRHVADLSYEEIVEITGLPMGTVKNRIFRAREAMRQELLKRGIDGVE